MDVIALKDLPGLGARKGDRLHVAPIRARDLVAQGSARWPDAPPTPASAVAKAPPAPLAGSRTGADAPPSSSAPAPAPKGKTSKPSAAKSKQAAPGS